LVAAAVVARGRSTRMFGPSPEALVLGSAKASPGMVNRP
jgi:hypothetical protein